MISMGCLFPNRDVYVRALILRDGVVEYQFNQVLNMELDQVIEVLRVEHCPLDLVTQINILCIFQVCKFLDENWSPKFAVIVAQKNHHAKFF
ncbi:hypothetical protein FNV43_RR22753 [Rhamnella rubrinervis]|uniref:Piwi domain-containing protein n=1 Tax=Rhamnella rubrinervis TaxID=2594499 RepID=A0A8K0DQR6_9ROSA|nr:hypothetical protein FNV43_RR22753 [Rhamnella rubrinervis]